MEEELASEADKPLETRLNGSQIILFFYKTCNGLVLVSITCVVKMILLQMQWFHYHLKFNYGIPNAASLNFSVEAVAVYLRIVIKATSYQPGVNGCHFVRDWCLRHTDSSTANSLKLRIQYSGHINSLTVNCMREYRICHPVRCNSAWLFFYFFPSFYVFGESSLQ